MSDKFVGELKTVLKTIKDDVSGLKKTVDDLKKPAYLAGQAPAFIKGGMASMQDDKFMISRLSANMYGVIDDSECKFEREYANKFKKAMSERFGHTYNPASYLIPLDWSLIPNDVKEEEFSQVIRKSMAASVADVDPDRCPVPFRKAMGFLDQTAGGSIVAPPVLGEMIPVLRNESVLNQIGATTVSMPPNGQIQYPRQVSASTAYAVGENPSVNTPESELETDSVTLSAKQFIGLVRVSNMLLKYSEGNAEAVIRNDLMAQVALQFDKDGLEGRGGTTRVQGLINVPNILTTIASSVGTNGNKFTPDDGYAMLAEMEERNIDPDKGFAWIMRPKTWYGLSRFRADAVAAGDQQGMFLFDWQRTFGQKIGKTMHGYNVFGSNQVSNTRTKGSASNLTYILGVAPQEVLLGMHGAVELSINTQEGQAYSRNQALLRVVMFGDIGVRRQAGVNLCDQLLQF